MSDKAIRLVTRTEHNDTVCRITRWRTRWATVTRMRVPPKGVDPYAVGFDQHDDASYAVAERYTAKIGRLRVSWDCEAQR